MSKGNSKFSVFKLLFGFVGRDLILLSAISLHLYFSDFKSLSSIILAVISIGAIIALITFRCMRMHENRAELAKIWKKLKTWYAMRALSKKARSINHMQTLMGKHVLGLDIAENEDEVTSYADISSHFGDKWPFMISVKNSGDALAEVRGKKALIISSYSYVDLVRDPRVQEAGIEAARQYATGNHGPRMLCGNLEVLEDLEKSLSKFLQKEEALVFSSGFLACMSVINGIAREGDVLLMDRLCHASLKTGARLTKAKIINFPHNDFVTAEKLLKKQKYTGRVIMVIEGVYSMDGDIGDLPTARKLADKYGALLILDEAHSIGTIGKTGRGAEEHFNYEYRADIICGSFTKSLASVGGFIACSKKLRWFYTFHAPGAVFSAPLSAYNAGAAAKALEILDTEPIHVTKCQENAKYFRERLLANGFDIEKSITCVIPVVFRDPIQLINMHAHLLKNGYFASAVMAPACPLNAPRFRITASSSQTKEEIDQVVNALIDARTSCPESDVIKTALDCAPNITN